MLSLGYCRRILASEKQESIATVSMKEKHFILFVARWLPLLVHLVH